MTKRPLDTSSSSNTVSVSENAPTSGLDLSTPIAAIAAKVRVADVFRLTSSRLAVPTSAAAPIAPLAAGTVPGPTVTRASRVDISPLAAIAASVRVADVLRLASARAAAADVHRGSNVLALDELATRMPARPSRRPQRMTMSPLPTTVTTPTSPPALRASRMTMSPASLDATRMSPANPVADALTRMSMTMPRRDDATPANGVPQRMTMADPSTGRIA